MRSNLFTASKGSSLSVPSSPNTSHSPSLHLSPFDRFQSRLFRASTPGDSRSKAFRINSNSFSRSERVGDREGDDYYRFDLRGKRDIEISVANREFFLGPSLEFRLQNANGNTIKSRRVRGNDSEEIDRELGKGTYYIKVESGGESVPYRLRFESESP